MTDTVSSIFTPCHCGLLRKASRHISQVYDMALASSGLKTTQLSLLVAIDRASEQKATLNEVAEMMVMDRSTLGHNLRPLERAGWIRVEKGSDRRSRHALLTPSGRTKLQKARVQWKRIQQRVESVFGGKDLSDLREALLKFAATEF